MNSRSLACLAALIFFLSAVVAAQETAAKPADAPAFTIGVTISQYALTGYGRSHIPPDRLRDIVVKDIKNPKKGVNPVALRNEQSGEEAVAEATSKGCNYLLTMAIGTPGKYRLVALTADEPVLQGEILINAQNSANDIVVPTERAAMDAVGKLLKRAKK